jgi:hypothetical protein
MRWAVLTGKPEGNRPRGKPRRRCEDEIRMALEETAWGVWSKFNWLKIGTGGGLL